MKQISNTLAGFKEVLTTAKANGIFITSTISDKEGRTIKENAPATIGRVQSNAFTLMRDGKEYWCEFGKAGQWVFNLPKGKATKLIGGDCLHLHFEPEFFNL